MNRLDVPDRYVELANAALREAAGRGEPEWLAERRRQAFARLQAAGFPTTRVEDWKYTNLRGLLESSFDLPRMDRLPDVGALLPRRLEDEHELIFVDGRYTPEHSRFDAEAGLEVVSLEEGLRNGQAAHLRERLAAELPGDDTPFVSLNQALSGCGVYLRVAPNAVVAKRLQILFLTTGLQPGVLVSPRVVVELGASAELRLVQAHIGHPGALAFTNVVTDLHVGANARLFYAKVQAEAPQSFHCSFVRASLAADSAVTLFDYSIGAKFARNDLVATVEGRGAEVHLDGLYAVKDRQVVDHHTAVDHRVPNGMSRQIYKGIVAGSARAVFNGKIQVREGAKQTDAYQVNRNLILGRNAAVNTKPQLEIANDDVKCTHGATIGQLDDDQLFYLQSRGIAADEAADMLARGFLEDVLFLIKDRPLQDSLRVLLDGYFAQGGARDRAYER